jgi:hypothetical protein
VKTYYVKAEQAGFSRKRRLLRGLLSGGLFGALNWIFNAFGPWISSGHGRVGEAVLSGAIFAFVYVATFNRTFNYKLVVSDDCITAIHPGYKRSVQKNELKRVAESNGNIWTAPSLRISKFGRFGTWFWGGIRIPKSLSEYESVRALALSWKNRSHNWGAGPVDENATFQE